MKPGDIAPNFILKTMDGKDFELYQNLNKKILLVFYPKDDTPVCSAQLAEYNENYDEFIRNEIKVVGINADTIQSHATFCKKLNLKFPLLADENKVVSRLFDAINIFGTNRRMVVLIGQDKKIIWKDSTIPITYIKSKEILEKVIGEAVKK